MVRPLLIFRAISFTFSPRVKRADPSFLSSGILNAGDVPNLYAPEDMDKILSTCRIDCQKKKLQPTKMNIFAQYIIRVQRNIHVVLCMSPLGGAFRDRMRMFPSLSNCCTIDWFR